MQIDPDDFRRHYALLSDDALLDVDRDELVDVARMCYDAELAERKLTRPDTARSVSTGEASAQTEDQTEGGLQMVATFVSIEEANFARGLLQ